MDSILSLRRGRGRVGEYAAVGDRQRIPASPFQFMGTDAAALEFAQHFQGSRRTADNHAPLALEVVFGGVEALAIGRENRVTVEVPAGRRPEPVHEAAILEIHDSSPGPGPACRNHGDLEIRRNGRVVPALRQLDAQADLARVVETCQPVIARGIARGAQEPRLRRGCGVAERAPHTSPQKRTDHLPARETQPPSRSRKFLGATVAPGPRLHVHPSLCRVSLRPGN